VTAVNDAPDAVPSSLVASTPEDTPLVGQLVLTDADGDAVSVDTTPVVAPSHGTVVLQADGRYTYTPDADFHGADSFTVRLSDGQGGLRDVVVAVSVTAVNDARTPITTSTPEDTPPPIDQITQTSTLETVTVSQPDPQIRVGEFMQTETGAVPLDRTGGTLATAVTTPPGERDVVPVTAGDGAGGSTPASSALAVAPTMYANAMAEGIKVGTPEPIEMYTQTFTPTSLILNEAINRLRSLGGTTEMQNQTPLQGALDQVDGPSTAALTESQGGLMQQATTAAISRFNRIAEATSGPFGISSPAGPTVDAPTVVPEPAEPAQPQAETPTAPPDPPAPTAALVPAAGQDPGATDPASLASAPLAEQLSRMASARERELQALAQALT